MRCCITVACLFLDYESCFMLIGMILGLKRYVSNCDPRRYETILTSQIGICS